MRAGRVARGQVRGRGAEVWAGGAHDGLTEHVAVPLTVVLMVVAIITTPSVPFRALVVVSAVHGLSGHVANSVLAVSAAFRQDNSPSVYLGAVDRRWLLADSHLELAIFRMTLQRLDGLHGVLDIGLVSERAACD